MTNPTGTTHRQSSTSYRVIVTGSRTWTDERAVWLVLWDALRDREPLLVRHGGARGVDTFADRWIRRAIRAGRQVTRDVHRPDYPRYGRWRAPLVRNEEMVTAGADECHAFVMPCEKPGCPDPKPHWTHGTDHCLTLAKAAGIPTTIHRWPT